ncbi:hypothetical protein E4U44_003442 [Claviceps purpurea]|nr:hypothetical protein E4U44_003442 [Claviceps purpurea]
MDLWYPPPPLAQSLLRDDGLSLAQLRTSRTYLLGAPNTIHTTKNAYRFEEGTGQVDIYFQKRTIEKGVKDKYSFENAGVVGELKERYVSGKFKEDFLQMALHVRSIFCAQPTRRYVHAFMLCGRMLELWIFDRSGACSSGIFDIDREPDKFARALVGYATVDDEMLGADTFIKSNGELSIEVDVNDEARSIKLEKLLAKPPCAIITRGTVDHLKQARSRGVEGVAKLVGYRHITSTTEMREELTFGKQHKFRLSDLPLQAGKSALGIEYLAISSTKNDASSVVAGPDPDSPGNELWGERKFSCHLISPVGQVIKDFKNVKQLLESLRDAIRAHRSLYVEGNILHRDISAHNIIITDHTEPDTGGFKGMLIDLDVACIAGRERGEWSTISDRHNTIYGGGAWDPVQGLAVEGETHCKERPFRKWHVDKLQDIAELKQGQMGGLETLDNLMREFPKALDVAEPLCEELGESFFSQRAKGKAMELFGTTQVILTIP